MSAPFSAGCLYVTPAVHALIRRGVDLRPFLSRHLQGDRGCQATTEKATCHHARYHGQCAQSAWPLTAYTRVLIRSEAGSTTIMLSDEETDRRIRYRHSGL